VDPIIVVYETQMAGRRRKHELIALAAHGCYGIIDIQKYPRPPIERFKLRGQVVEQGY